MSRTPYRPIPKPASLDDINVRFAEVVRHSDESLREWAAMMGTTTRRLKCVINGIPLNPRQGPSRLSAKDMLAVNELCAGAFLTPPELEYAEKARRRSLRKRRYSALQS